MERLLFGFPLSPGRCSCVWRAHRKSAWGLSPALSAVLSSGLVRAPGFPLQRVWNLEPNLKELQRRLERDISQDHGVAEQEGMA